MSDASACPPQDACLLYGLPETEIARLAIWIRIDALVATLRPGGQTEGVPESPTSTSRAKLGRSAPVAHATRLSTTTAS